MTTATLPPKLHSKLVSNFTVYSTQNTLDASFATINWQAPWLCHLKQLDYLTDQVQKLSEQGDSVDNNAKNKVVF